MVVRIRLSRWGAKHNPFYGIVVANSRQAQTQFIERIGTYNPIKTEQVKQVSIDFTRAKYWISVGAQPTSRVQWLLNKAGLFPAKPIQEIKPRILPALKKGVAMEALTPSEALYLLQKQGGIH